VVVAGVIAGVTVMIIAIGVDEKEEKLSGKVSIRAVMHVAGEKRILTITII
jgi:hypothetical protein